MFMWEVDDATAVPRSASETSHVASSYRLPLLCIASFLPISVSSPWHVHWLFTFLALLLVGIILEQDAEIFFSIGKTCM